MRQDPGHARLCRKYLDRWHPVFDAVRTAVVGSARTGLVFEAGLIARKYLPTFATLATHDRHSLKHDDSILHTHHSCRTT